LTRIIPLALLKEDLELPQEELDRLGAEAIALTHGEPEAYITGAALTHLLCLLLKDPHIPMSELVQHTLDAVRSQFGQIGRLDKLLQQALDLAISPDVTLSEAMETLGCRTAAEALAGAVYAVCTCGRDFDQAMITAVNHSGRSSAVGALTGCMLGAIWGDAALPEFYLENLEAAPYITELADDLAAGFSEMVGRSLFDIDWERKYIYAGK
jgi:ADP-ribosylglycohydrolase